MNLIKSLFRYFHISKPDRIYHQNGNYFWTFKRIGPFYYLENLKYEE